jgi:hypothetical protein
VEGRGGICKVHIFISFIYLTAPITEKSYTLRFEGKAIHRNSLTRHSHSKCSYVPQRRRILRDRQKREAKYRLHKTTLRKLVLLELKLVARDKEVMPANHLL